MNAAGDGFDWESDLPALAGRPVKLSFCSSLITAPMLAKSIATEAGGVGLTDLTHLQHTRIPPSAKTGLAGFGRVVASVDDL